MATASTTTMICENTDGYFAAFLNNGGVRVGLVGCTCFDIPLDHKDFKRCASLTMETVEETHDEFTGRYCFN